MSKSAKRVAILAEIFRRLFAAYGPQEWWPSNSSFETIVGAILTQNTAWTNVDKALSNLWSAGLMTPSAIRNVPEGQLAEVIRPSGYFNAKARKLKAMAQHLELYGDDTNSWGSRTVEDLRGELLSVYGIGPETADDIVLYVAGLPSFVIDTYSIRLVDRIGISVKRKRYEDYQALFENNLARDAQLFNEYHALLDAHAKYICHKRNPACAECVLCDICKEGKRRT